MGLLSNIGTAIKSTVSKVATAVKAADIKLGGGTSPDSTQKLSSQLVGGAKTAAVAIPITKAAELPKVTAAVATAAKGAATAIATKAKSTAAAHPVATGGAAILTAGFIAENPKQAVSSLSNVTSAAVSGLYNVGGNVQQFTANPSIDTAKNILTENPVIVGGAAAIVGGAATKTLIGASILKSSLETEKEIKTETAEITPVSVLPKETAATGAILPTTSAGVQAQPITPETQIIGKAAKTTSLTRKGKGKHYKQPIQSTKINIINQSRLFQTKKYIY